MKVTKAAPYAKLAVIANKQDLPNALKVEEIEEIMGQKTYPIVGNDPKSRDTMLRILADLLEMNPDISPLFEPMIKRKFLIKKGQDALEQGELKEAVETFDKIYDICIELGDESLAIEYKTKSDKLRKVIQFF